MRSWDETRLDGELSFNDHKVVYVNIELIKALISYLSSNSLVLCCFIPAAAPVFHKWTKVHTTGGLL